MSVSSDAGSFLDDFGDLYDDDDGVYEFEEDGNPPMPQRQQDEQHHPPAVEARPRQPGGRAASVGAGSGGGRNSPRSSHRGSRGSRGPGRQAGPTIPEWAKPPEGRWRGGTCPRAPEFDADIEKDPACLRHWKREIKIWLKRAKSHLPPNELALDLLGALKGRAKAQLATVDPDVFDHPDGVQRLIDRFETSCREPVALRSSIAMNKYENLKREKGQSMTSYVEAWRIAEAELGDAGIGTYPQEVRGARLLEGAGLVDQSRQIVLNTAGNKYDPERIAEALLIHYPPYMPGKVIKKSTPSGSGTGGAHSSPFLRGGRGRGRGRGRGGRWRTLLGDATDEDEEADDHDDGQDGAEDAPVEEEEQNVDATAVQEVADALTATAKKLKDFTLGRGWSKGPPGKGGGGAKGGGSGRGGQSRGRGRAGKGTGRSKKTGKAGFRLKPGETFADLKKRTACSVCGKIGHWKGDPECPSDGSRAVCVCGAILDEAGVLLTIEEGDEEDEEDDQQEGEGVFEYKECFENLTCLPCSPTTTAPPPASEAPAVPRGATGTFFAFPAESSSEGEVYNVRDVFLNAPEPPTFMVIDTGCQRTVAGTTFLDAHEATLRESHGLCHVRSPEKQHYRFGKGSSVCSTESRWIPIGLMEIPLLLRSSSVNVNIPLLGSRSFLSQMGAVLDIPQATVFFGALNITRELFLSANGHLCIKINELPRKFPRSADSWARDERFEVVGQGLSSLSSLPAARNVPRPLSGFASRPSLPSGNDGADADASGSTPRHHPEMDAHDGPLLTASQLLHGRRPQSSHPRPLRPHERSHCGHIRAEHHSPLLDECRNNRSHARARTPELARGQGDVPPQRRDPELRGALRAGQALHDVREQVASGGGEPLGGNGAQAEPGVDPGAAGRAEPEGQGEGRGQGREPQPVFPAAAVGSTAADNDSRGSEPGWAAAFRTLGTALVTALDSTFGCRSGSSSPGPAINGCLATSPVPRATGDARRSSDADDRIRAATAPSGPSLRPHPQRRPGRRQHDFVLEPGELCGRGGGLREPGGSRRECGEPYLARVSGVAVRVADATKTAAEILDTEQKVYASVCRGKVRNRCRVDVAELWADQAEITRQCHRFGLRGVQPFGLRYGTRISRDDQAVWDFIKLFVPLLVIMAVPCTVWSILNWNLNYAWRRNELLSRQQKERHQIKLAAKIAHHQMSEGRLFLIENPASSRIWLLPEVLQLLKDPRVFCVTANGCAFGLRARSGKFLAKKWRFVTNDRALSETLCRKCPGESQWHQHERCEGSNTRESQNYPVPLAHTVLRRVRALVIERGDSLRYLPDTDKPTKYSWRVAEADTWAPADERDVPIEAEVFYLDVVKDEVAWRAVMEEAESAFSTASDRNLVALPGQSVYERVKALCPWEIARVLVVRAPAARRLPTNITTPFTHRACVLWYTDGSLEVESQATRDLLRAGTRFVRPCKLGIFIFGTAPESSFDADGTPTGGPAEEASGSQRRQRPRGDAAAAAAPPPVLPQAKDIWFEGIKLDQVPQVIRNAVRRLHINLAHPSNADLVRYLASSNASTKALLAAKSLRCASCLRQQKPSEPRPSRIPRVGRFNSLIGMDIVYCSDALGNTIMFLGIIDDSSLYHVAVLITSRDSLTIWNALKTVWFTPFGPPERILCDKERGFVSAEFLRRASLLGIVVSPVPAEAHWRLGRIERHNYTFKVILGKVVDEWQVTDHEEAQMAAIFVYSAKNSLLRRGGCSPNMHVFGREPRLPGALLSDPDNPHVQEAATLDEELSRAFAMRAAAQKAFIDYENDDHLRRAMLRQGRPWKGPLEPGMRVAFWRKQRPEREAIGRKPQPGYELGTIVTVDTRTSGTIWIRADRSGQVVECAREQVRSAVGFELWSPNTDDIKHLREVERALRQEQRREDAALAAPPPVLAPPAPAAAPPDRAGPSADEDVADLVPSGSADPGFSGEPVQPQLADDTLQSALRLQPQPPAAALPPILEDEDLALEPTTAAGVEHETPEQPENQMMELDPPSGVRRDVSPASSAFEMPSKRLRTEGMTEVDLLIVALASALRPSQCRPVLPAAREAPTYIGPPMTTSVLDSLAARPGTRQAGDCFVMVSEDARTHVDIAPRSYHRSTAIKDRKTRKWRLLEWGATSLPDQQDLAGLYGRGTGRHKWHDFQVSVGEGKQTVAEMQDVDGHLSVAVWGQDGTWHWAVENSTDNESNLPILDYDHVIALRRKFHTTPHDSAVSIAYPRNRTSFSVLPVSLEPAFENYLCCRRWHRDVRLDTWLSKVDGWDGSGDVPQGFLNVLHLESTVSVLSAEWHSAADQEEKHKKSPDPRGRTAKKDNDENVYLASSSDEGDDGSPTVSRKEQKALDREVPWRQIRPDDLNLFSDAVRKEWTEWLRWGAVRPATMDEVKTLKNDHVLPARVAYRWKPTANEGHKAKARIVVQGFRDPHLPLLARDSPVLTRAGFLLLLQVCSTNHGHVDGAWLLLSGDCSSAFLQGGAAPDRPAPIFMRVPKDPISIAGCQFETAIYVIIGSVYGLCNSPRLWFAEVRRRLMDIGFVPHPLDPALFLYWNRRVTPSALLAMIGFHVDDSLLTMNPKANWLHKKLREAFEWGSWDRDDFIFTGKHVKLNRESGVILITMERFVSETKVVMPQYRGRLEASLSDAEMTEFRSAIGCLQWLASSARPDLAADTSLCQGPEPKVKDLCEVQRVLKYAKSTPDGGICIRPVPWDEIAFFAYSDASWANAANSKTQAGMLILIASMRAFTETVDASIVEWKSHRLRRAVRSTLAAEAASMDAAVDHSVYLAHFLSCIHKEGHVVSGTSSPLFKVVPITDCRSLYDALQRLSASLQEKRVLLDLVSIRETCGGNMESSSSVRWVPTHVQLADGLTKRDKQLRDRLAEFCARPRLSLTQAAAEASASHA